MDEVQTRVLQFFSAAYVSGRLAHAYLLTGPRGCGKRALALAAAKLVNCAADEGFQPGCKCPSCKKIDSGNHPDIFLLQRDQEHSQIIIEQIRDLRDRFQLRVWEGRMRVGIIADADDMNASAANALLKTLEEPFARTLLVLTTSVSDRIPLTIRSRCQEVMVAGRSKSALAQGLINEYHVPSAAARVMAGFAKGSAGCAAGLSEGFMERRNTVIDRFILGKPEYDLIKAFTEEKETSREALDIVLTFFRDVALFQRGVSADHLIHADRIAAIEQAAGGLSPADVERVTAAAVSAIRGMRENMNIRLSLILLKEMM